MGVPAFVPALLGTVVDGFLKFIPDTNERLRAKEMLEGQLITIVSAATQGQLEINKQEAAHNSLFVAGWRPFIGWVCGVGIAWQFVFAPIANWVLLLVVAANPEITTFPDLPKLDMSEIMSLVMAMLGMGGLRTFEKMRGVSREK